MNGNSTETGADEARLRAAILRILESRDKKAQFVTELSAALARASDNTELVERILAELAGQGVIMLRDHFCADPHLAGVDLRIAALVAADAPDTEAQMNAIHAIDTAWEKWLAEYLANHRCS